MPEFASRSRKEPAMYIGGGLLTLLLIILLLILIF
jgi:hypothetical protein